MDNIFNKRLMSRQVCSQFWEKTSLRRILIIYEDVSIKIEKWRFRNCVPGKIKEIVCTEKCVCVCVCAHMQRWAYVTVQDQSEKEITFSRKPGLLSDHISFLTFLTVIAVIVPRPVSWALAWAHEFLSLSPIAWCRVRVISSWWLITQWPGKN